MTRTELINELNNMLLAEMPEYRDSAERFGNDICSRRRLLRSLMNLRPPFPLSDDLTKLQDILLYAERGEKGVVGIADIPEIQPHIRLWRGDITRLRTDAIVNAANSALLGCFCPCHGCIDNAIHSAAGLQLRNECAELMRAQGHDEPAGRAKLTKAYNLPTKYVIHTVGPIITGEVTETDCITLVSCYRSCLELAADNGIRSIAFCCISTGEFHFPNEKAADIAVSTVQNFLSEHKDTEVVFNVFKEQDERIYRNILGGNKPNKG